MKTKKLTSGIHMVKLTGLAATTLLISLGCAANVPTQTRLMQEVGNVALSTSELHDLTYEYSKFYTSEVESAADRIRSASTDDEVRYNALLWKSYSIPAMHRAALQRDPMAALIDLRAFNMQVRNYFTDGAGRELFGDLQPVALEACDELDAVLMTAVRWALPERDSTRQDSIIAAYAEANPITDPLFVRTSTRPLLINMTAMNVKGGLGGVAQINESVAAINDRLEVYTETLPRQIRWQAEMVIEDYLRREDVPQLRASVASIDSSLSLFANFIGGVDDLVAQERSLILEETNRSLEGAYAEIDRQRATVIEDVDSQRQQVVADVAALSERTIDHATDNMNGLADRLFAKLVALAVGLVVSLLIVGVILIVLARLMRRPSTPAEA